MASQSRLAPLNDSNKFDSQELNSPYLVSPVLNRERYPEQATDPLLTNTSPAAVLLALRDTSTVSHSTGSNETVLLNSIAQASQHERALGLRVASLLKRLEEWTEELHSWAWPSNGFEPPEDNIDGTYWGSLPQKVVIERDDRLEQIQDELDIFDVEGLKNHIRNVHLQPQQTRRVSAIFETSSGSSSYYELADFNALVTAMIMQALPELARLSKYLNNWTVRLLVLKQIPGFLQCLHITKVALRSAWTSISQSELSSELQFTRHAYEQIRDVLERNVTDLAKRIDAILDALEGDDHSIPDKWIDDMEDAEQEYKNWVIEAERLIGLHEWHMSSSNNIEQQVNGDSYRAPRLTDEPATKANGLIAKEQSALIKGLAPMDANGTESTELERSNATSHPETAIGDNRQTSPVRNHPTASTGITDSSEFSPLPVAVNTEREQNPDYVLPNDTQDLSPTTQNGAPKIARKPVPLHLDTSPKSIEPALKSHLSTITSPSSGGFTDMSSPQIFDASEIQYYRSPMDDNFPVTITRDAEDISFLKSTGYTAANRFKHGRSISAIEPMTRSRASSVQSQVTINAGDREDRTRAATNGALHTESIQETSLDAEDEFYDAPTSPRPMNASPELSVRKTRLSSDHSDLSDKSSILRLQHNERQSKHVEDKMTAKISRLLTKIPAPIKLSDHPPEPGLDLFDKKLRSLPRQQRSVTPALTLSPVTSDSKSIKPANSSNESGIRVYHLHQPGKTVPIKLFIRLVGAEDRVMVRVGGGWADLAEYLKEYATHHGHRSISTNSFELAGLPTAQNAASSLFDSRVSPAASPVGTPGSVITGPRRSFVESPRTTSLATTPSPISNRPHTPPSPITTEYDETSYVGLAGPKSKPISLSPRKKAWVDGMMNQARNISGGSPGNGVGEIRKTDELVDMGKVGSTSRVFFKGKVDD